MGDAGCCLGCLVHRLKELTVPWYPVECQSRFREKQNIVEGNGKVTGQERVAGRDRVAGQDGAARQGTVQFRVR